MQHKITFYFFATILMSVSAYSKQPTKIIMFDSTKADFQQLDKQLIDAIKLGLVDKVEELLRQGADPNASNGKAIVDAAQHYPKYKDISEKILDLLMRNGANPRPSGCKWETEFSPSNPYQIPSCSPISKMGCTGKNISSANASSQGPLEYLLRNYKDRFEQRMKDLLLYRSYCSASETQAVIDAGANVNAVWKYTDLSKKCRSRCGFSPLFSAVANCDGESVDILLSHGASTAAKFNLTHGVSAQVAARKKLQEWERRLKPHLEQEKAEDPDTTRKGFVYVVDLCKRAAALLEKSPEPTANKLKESATNAH